MFKADKHGSEAGTGGNLAALADKTLRTVRAYPGSVEAREAVERFIDAALSAPVGDDPDPTDEIYYEGFEEGRRTRPAPVGATKFECAARKQGLPEPADCSWPTCGCDPYASKVIESLEEQGALNTHPPAPAVGAEEVARIIEGNEHWTARTKANAILSLLSVKAGG